MPRAIQARDSFFVTYGRALVRGEVQNNEMVNLSAKIMIQRPEIIYTTFTRHIDESNYKLLGFFSDANVS